MADREPRLWKGPIRAALARDRYARSEACIADPDVAGFTALVATHRGLFAVSEGRAKTVMHGWFFGICREGNRVYLFENCGARDPEPLGRILTFDLVDGRLTGPTVIAAGLHNNCHQIRVIDEHLCVVDTANQAILRFHTDGSPVDVQRPFPPAEVGSSGGDYLHINSIAKIGDRIAVMLHNGKARPEKRSEIAWLDSSWQVQAREPVPGYSCHDIVEDEGGTIWHSASMSGEIVGSDGTRIRISGELMTRGLAITAESVIVGISTFGPRHIRHTLNGGIVFLDRDLSKRSEIQLPAGPTDIAPL